MIERIFNGAGRQVAGLYGKVLLNVQVEWQAPLPTGPKIIAANHPTTTDPFLLMGLIGEPMSILITESCFKLPGLGAFLRAAGHVPVVSGGGKAALDEGIRLLRAGRTVGIFPEGVLSPLDQLGRGGCSSPHTGVARLALATGAPVIPVGISLDPARIIFRETVIDGVTEHVRWVCRGPYFATAGRPMAFTGSLEDRVGVRLAAARIMNRVAGLAQYSASRLRSEAELGAAPVPFPSFGQE
jgi:1-acyl-sn-glycerol-3-phosphate acyltransferase